MSKTIAAEPLINKEDDRDALTSVTAMMTLVTNGFPRPQITFPNIEEVISYVTREDPARIIYGILRLGSSGLERAIFKKDKEPSRHVEVISAKNVMASPAVVLVFEGESLVHVIRRESFLKNLFPSI